MYRFDRSKEITVPKPVTRKAAPAPAAAKATSAGKGPAPAGVKRPPFKSGPAKPAAKPAPVEEVEEPVEAEESAAEEGTKDVDLSDMEQDWNDAETRTSGEIPDGKYQALINTKGDRLGIGHSQNGRRQVVFQCTIVGGEMANRKVWKRDGIDNAESIGWFKGSLKRLGIEPPASSKDLPEVVDSIDGMFAEISVKNKGEFANVYFNKPLDADEVDTSGLEEEPADEAEGDASEEAEAEAPKATKKVSKVSKVSAPTLKVGQKVQADFGGDYYTGTIKSIKGADATVSWEDGEVSARPLSELEAFNPDGDKDADADAVAEESTEEATEEGETAEPTVNIKFSEKSLSPLHVKLITALAQKHDFDPDNYNEWSALLGDIAEFCGISGEFSKVDVLIKQVQSAKPAA